MTRIFLITLLSILLITCKKGDDEILILSLDESEILHSPISIVLNPYGITPLAALVSFESLEPTTVEVHVNGAVPIDFKIEDASKIHQFPLLGLYPDTTNRVFITIINENEQYFRDTLEVATPPLPDHLPTIEILKADPNVMEPGMTLCELNIGGNGKLRTQPILFDHQGNIRWYIDLSFTDGWTAPLKRLQNGNLVFARGHHIFEYNWVGKEINKWTNWDYFQHHDLIEIPNGNFIIPVSQTGIGTGLDQIIEVDRATGDVIRQWDLREILDVDRFDLLWQSFDWVHVNSVWYDERDESLLVSGRNQGVFKVSKENELQWILAPHRGWGQAGVNGDGPRTADFLLTAIDGIQNFYNEDIQNGMERATFFDWPWGQHSAQLLDNGHVLLFDNGWKRYFENAGQQGHSRAVEYQVDEFNKTVRQIWEYGKDRHQETFSENISSVSHLPQTFNRLFCPGNIHNAELIGGKVVEITIPRNTVVFEANIHYKNNFSNGSGWGNADLIYRSERLELY